MRKNAMMNFDSGMIVKSTHSIRMISSSLATESYSILTKSYDNVPSGVVSCYKVKSCNIASKFSTIRPN